MKHTTMTYLSKKEIEQSTTLQYKQGLNFPFGQSTSLKDTDKNHTINKV